jgi:ribosomal protein S18 acetylase RimI-like enzyme
MDAILDNVIWHALTGPQARFAVGTPRARRFAPGFAPLTGFPDPATPDLDALMPFSEPGEAVFCAGWSGTVLPGWRILFEGTMFRMVWAGRPPEGRSASDAIPLGPEHAAQAVELATLTRPGPFGLRTTELGDYFGIFDGPRLVAMAGERMHAGHFREVSGVCTHPDFQGRGFARQLVTLVIQRQLDRGQTPFLHVMRENTQPRALYERMGFRDYLAVPLRIVRRRQSGAGEPI